MYVFFLSDWFFYRKFFNLGSYAEFVLFRDESIFFFLLMFFWGGGEGSVFCSVDADPFHIIGEGGGFAQGSISLILCLSSCLLSSTSFEVPASIYARWEKPNLVVLFLPCCHYTPHHGSV